MRARELLDRLDILMRPRVGVIPAQSTQRCFREFLCLVDIFAESVPATGAEPITYSSGLSQSFDVYFMTPIFLRSMVTKTAAMSTTPLTMFCR